MYNSSVYKDIQHLLNKKDVKRRPYVFKLAQCDAEKFDILF